MSEGIHLEGVAQVLSALQHATEQQRKGARKGIGVALENVLRVSNKQVPYEEGDLSRDGGSSIDDVRLRGAVSYGRSADTAKYAERQHEDMSYRHDSGRNAKYLENAFNSTRGQNAAIITTAIRREMGT